MLNIMNNVTPPPPHNNWVILKCVYSSGSYLSYNEFMNSRWSCSVSMINQLENWYLQFHNFGRGLQNSKLMIVKLLPHDVHVRATCALYDQPRLYQKP